MTDRLDAPGTRTVRPSGQRGRTGHQPLAAAVAVVAVVSSAIGLLSEGVYGGDQSTVQMLRGFDSVTVFLVGPAMLLAVVADRRGSTLGRLLVASMLAYLGYTFAYHLLGAGFTDLMLLHSPLVSLTLVALLLTLRNLPMVELAGRARTGMRVPAVLLGLLAVSLGAMWVYAGVAYVLDETMPAGSSLVESDTIVHLGIVLDLTVLVPLYGAAAVLLWRHRAQGFVLAALALVAGTLHQISYVVALLFQFSANVPGSVPLDPVEPVILLIYVIATAYLLRTPGGSGRQGGW